MLYMLCKALSPLTQPCASFCSVLSPHRLQLALMTVTANHHQLHISVDGVTSLLIWQRGFHNSHRCMQGLLQRLASATQPFNFRALSDSTAAARHIAEATVNTGTYEQLLRAAVAAIVRPSSRSSQHLCCAVCAVLCCA